MYNSKKIITVIAGTLIALALYTNKAYASGQGTVTLTVSITGVVGLELSTTQISFPAVQCNGSVTSNGSVSVKALDNNSVNMKVGLSQIVPSGFTIGTSTPGYKEYVLCGVFALNQPQPGSFTVGIADGDDTITNTPRLTGNGNFAASDDPAEDGYNIAPGDAESLWFRFIAPTSIDVPTTLSIEVIISAESM